MSNTGMSDIIKSSLDGIRNVVGAETAIGTPIQTPSGVTVIPISKVTVGFATGGLDFVQKKFASPQNFGGGGGTGVSITPLGFLTVGKNAEINLIHLSAPTSTVDKTLSLIEEAPEIIARIKNILS